MTEVRLTRRAHRILDALTWAAATVIISGTMATLAWAWYAH